MSEIKSLEEKPLKIGVIEFKNKLILAPMAGVTDYPFRMICRDYGCELAYSEMVSSEGLIRNGKKTSSYLYRGEDEKNKYIGFQIFGSKPDSLAEAGQIVEEKGADIVDINMGCPVKKVVKTGAGSALLKDIKLISQIVSAVRKKIRVPLTVKIRAGYGSTVNVLEVARVLEDNGVNAIILHARTQSQGFGGQANWRLIEQVKKELTIPVIGNGDVVSVEDYYKMLRETGCDGVMIGRGAQGNPFLFKQINDKNYKPSLGEIQKTIERHYRLSMNFYGERKAIKDMRKHLSWYTKGFSNGAKFREKINAISDSAEVLLELNRFFSYWKELELTPRF